MSFHFALVDDLISREEFDRRVEETITASGDLLDEPTAAMLVVRDLGRNHVKVAQVGSGSTLSCFFGKVVSVSSPKEFSRSDGTTGLVSHILVGDETGQARVVLWDDRAMAVQEVGVGEVLEVIGKKGKEGAPEVHGLALRKADCEISCAMSPDDRFRPPEEIPEMEIRVLSLSPPAAFTRRNGEQGERVEALVATTDGTRRLVCWAPEVLAEMVPGQGLRIRGATRVVRDRGEEYHLDRNAIVTPSDAEIHVPVTPVSGITEGMTLSVQGTVARARPARPFTTRQGETSWVRNLVIQDATGSIALVLWADHARADLDPGDPVTLHHVTARKGRDGSLEVHAGRGSALVLPESESREVEMEGTVVPVAGGLCLDDGAWCHPLEGDIDIQVGAEVRLRGTLERRRLVPRSCEVKEPDSGGVQERLGRLLSSLGA
ncbi:MAG: nucleotide-binding protein [Methanomicrobiales archaeon]|nr:nucleotide-binding protein [Methanomicrobiales archaeon]